MRSVKGEITVFLSLSFTLLLSFIFGILESAVIQGSKNLSRIDTDRAIYSVFGEYHQELMEKMKDYMLEPNYLMLSEKYIFEKNENYFFCFFPENEKTWQVSYHELTEYFVRKVDYQDLESIQLACMLHKETLKETYDLESILQQYEEEAKNREEKSKEEKIREESKREKDRREMEENQNIEVQENSYYNKARENYAVMEEKRYGPIKKFAKRFKSGKWGEWEDLITEADDYE